MITPEKLLVALVREGIDFGMIAAKMPPRRSRPSRDPLVKRRQMKMVGIDPSTGRRRRSELERRAVTTARGRQREGSGGPHSIMEDFALACRSMDEYPYAVLCYTAFPDSEPDRIKLKSRLLLLAADLAQSENWPKKMNRMDCVQCGRAACQTYLEDLATLALQEWRLPDVFRRQEDLARWFGVTQGYWSKTVAKRYQPLRDQLAIWYGDAMRHIWRSLHEEEYSEEYSAKEQIA